MPYIGFMTRQFNNALHFLLKEPFAENLQRLTKDAAEAFPDKTIDFTSMEEGMNMLYNPVRVFRNATAVAGVVMIIIMLMGLLGDSTHAAVPAGVIGTSSSWSVISLRMDMFSAQASMSAAVYVLIGVAVLAVITGCVLWKSWRIANENPVLSIKSE